MGIQQCCQTKAWKRRTQVIDEGHADDHDDALQDLRRVNHEQDEEHDDDHAHDEGHNDDEDDDAVEYEYDVTFEVMMNNVMMQRGKERVLATNRKVHAGSEDENDDDDDEDDDDENDEEDDDDDNGDDDIDVDDHVTYEVMMKNVQMQGGTGLGNECVLSRNLKMEKPNMDLF